MHKLNRFAQSVAMTRRLAFALLALVALCLPAAAKVNIQPVTSEKGVTAWLVEDYSVPIVAIRFAFEGGSAQDPVGKEGLAELMTTLFDEGAGDLDSEAFQIRMDDSGAEMRFGAGSETVYGSMRLLADRKDEAFELLRIAINQPRFDKNAIERMRAQAIAGIVASKNDPNTAAQERFSKALYGDHPYGRTDGTEATLAAITRDDLVDFHKALFARGRLRVAVVGAIDAATVKAELDRLFGGLPEQSSLSAVPDVTPRLDQTVDVDYPLPQTTLQLVYPGIERDAPDFFAAYLMNHILGGGTFSSRLFDEVREKRGLAYTVSSGLSNRDHSSALTIGTATRSDRAAETLAVIREVIAAMAETGPTARELADARKYVIGSYALNNLDSSSSIAGTLIALQRDGLGIDYMERRAGIIDAVTLDDVKAVAKKLLSAQPAVLVIGPPLKDSGKG